MTELTRWRELEQKRWEVWRAAHAIAKRAADENRNLTDAEEGRFENLNTELDRLTARQKRIKPPKPPLSPAKARAELMKRRYGPGGAA